MDRDAAVGIVVPTWNRPAAALRCLGALACLGHAPRFTVVVDNGSRKPDREALAAGAARREGVEVLALEENRGFAGAVNVGLAAVFGRGAAAALVVNDDAVVAPGALGALVAAAAADPAAGVLAPRVLDRDSGREVSRGERVALPLLCLPRTWLRVRRAGPAPYAVSGVLGVTFLVTRACYERVGALAEPFFAYYEEVDYCLRVRRAGLRVVVVPAASVRHAGFRGFAGGFTPLAAYLKARNLPLVVRRHGGPLARALFLPSYLALVAASALVYAARGEGVTVLPALARGVADGLLARSGPPPAALVGPRR
jgi:GT2 family glycosyltransferase